MQAGNKNLSAWSTVGFAAAAILSFHLAYNIEHCRILLVVFLYCLLQLANVPTGRIAFYVGLGIGLATYAPHLNFFWNIFQVAAIALWVVLSSWLALFLWLGWACRRQFGFVGWACVAPIFWIGLEYFRSELYYLRFSWLNIGYAFSTSAGLHYLSGYGVYGIGFVLMTLAAIAAIFRQIGNKGRLMAGCLALLLFLYPLLAPRAQFSAQPGLRITGAQLESPLPAGIILVLNRAKAKFPDTDLFVLSEYSFNGPIPNLVKKWCRKNGKYLVAGGEEPTNGTQYYNTAFVVGPTGEIVFQQAKCYPVQFIIDGLPAPQQRVWDSPWGKLGFGICYDAGYTRATDELIRQGAQGLIFPTMDAEDWGEYQHRLHARIVPMRAAEYAVPVFRVCSSGISQYADPSGRVVASAPYPGQGEIMSAKVQLTSKGRTPPDRWLAKLAVGLTIALAVFLALERARQRLIITVTQRK